MAYLTVKGRDGQGKDHRRLTAVLCVDALMDDHRQAAAWYKKQGHDLPSNCVVPGNPPLPLSHSHMHGRLRSAGAGKPGCGAGGCGAGVKGEWDRVYRKRALLYPRFVICTPLYVNLTWDAPVVHDHHLVYAFGKVPGTRNPGALPMEDLSRFMRRLDLTLDARPSRR